MSRRRGRRGALLHPAGFRPGQDGTGQGRAGQWDSQARRTRLQPATTATARANSRGRQKQSSAMTGKGPMWVAVGVAGRHLCSLCARSREPRTDACSSCLAYTQHTQHIQHIQHMQQHIPPLAASTHVPIHTHACTQSPSSHTCSICIDLRLAVVTA